MIINRCIKCGKLIHEAGKCFWCGNTVEFTRVNTNVVVHDNVKQEYSQLELLLKNEKYDEILEFSDVILEWMPFCSDIFWIRLLAKHKCNTDEALIYKGFSCDYSGDYYNAVLYADEMQKDIYLSVADKISSAKVSLVKCIREHEYKEKYNTSIMKIQSEYDYEIENYRNKLFSNWEKLNQVENKMAIAEKDYLLTTYEYKDALDKVSQSAVVIQYKACTLERCSATEYQWFVSQFDSLTLQSDQAKKNLDSIEKSEVIDDYDALIKKRDEFISKIKEDIKSMKEYEDYVKSTISEIEKIEIRHKLALDDVERCNFSEVRRLIGETSFVLAFKEAGIV